MAERAPQAPPVLLIAETRPMVAAGFKVLLAGLPETQPVAITSGFEDVVAYADQNEIGLIIVGEGRDGATPLGEFHRFHAHNPGWRLALMADLADRETIRAGLSAGASGILSTMIEEHELHPAITRILAGSIYLPNMSSTEPPRPAWSGNQAVPAERVLTPRQSEVLGVLAQGHSNKQIARILRITESTVSMHLNAAFQALGVRNRTSAALAYRAMSGEGLWPHAVDVDPLIPAPGTARPMLAVQQLGHARLAGQDV